MKQLIYAFNALILILTLSNVSLYCMWFTYPEHWIALEWEFRQAKKRVQKEDALYAEEYNQRNQLFKLSNNILKQIILYGKPDDTNTLQALRTNLKYYIQLRAVSKHFQNILTFKTIGKFCKPYDYATKKELFEQILKLMGKNDDKIIRMPILSLSYSGVNTPVHNKYPNDLFFKIVTNKSDQDLIKTLFKHQIDPNTKWGETPIFFYAKTVAIAEMFINNGVNVHILNNQKRNVLWFVIKDGYDNDEHPAELLSLYLKHNVDPYIVDNENNCLLHTLVETHSAYVKDSKNLLKKVRLVLNVIPTMINTISKQGLTPLDVANQTLKTSEKSEYTNSKIIKKIIRLYRNCNARTADNINYFLLPRIECSLCFEKKIIGACHTMQACLNGQVGCGAIFCKECLLQYIIVHLEEGSTLELTCPNIQCARKMHRSDIQIIIHDIKHNKIDLYQRYLDISFTEFIMQNSNIIKQCPTLECTCTYEIDVNVPYRLKCPSCKHIYCSHCRVRHAPEMSCKQAYEHAQRVQNKDKQQIANQEWLDQHAKACPRCNTLIEKNGSCLYMFCRKCGHEFCWKCLQPHDHSDDHPCGLWQEDDV